MLPGVSPYVQVLIKKTQSLDLNPISRRGSVGRMAMTQSRPAARNPIVVLGFLSRT